MGKTKLTPRLIREIIKWTRTRNEVIHRLYTNPDSYEALKIKSMEYALQGLDYATLMYKEANRLKYLRKKHPEYFAGFSFLCPQMALGTMKQVCINAKQWKPKEKEGTQ